MKSEIDLFSPCPAKDGRPDFLKNAVIPGSGRKMDGFFEPSGGISFAVRCIRPAMHAWTCNHFQVQRVQLPWLRPGLTSIETRFA